MKNEPVFDETTFDESYKEGDLILEYNQVTLDDVSIVNILGIGIDNMTSSQAVVRVLDMIKDGGVYHIIPLNPYKLMRAKSSIELNAIINKADIHLPSGGGLLWAARIL